MSADFDAFWAAYPRRRGANPRAPARTSWDKAIKKGASPEAVLAGAMAYAVDPSTKVGTEFVAQAVTWLNQRRWEDYAPQPSHAKAGVPGQPMAVLVAVDSPQWEAWAKHLGKTPPVNREFGWYFPTEWPPSDVVPKDDEQDYGPAGTEYENSKEYLHGLSPEFIR